MLISKKTGCFKCDRGEMQEPNIEIKGSFQVSISICNNKECGADTHIILGIWDDADKKFHHTESKYRKMGLGYKDYYRNDY